VEIITGDELDNPFAEYNRLADEGRIGFVTFHQSYSYEEFIEGLRPDTDNGERISYTIQDGIFKEFCNRARKVPEERFVFIIDEINRGNISRILGELITLLEPTKREGREEALSVTLPYSKSRFSVPSNVYVIGTMNTADKSLVSLDAALRRRFRFKEMMTDYSLVPDNVQGIDVRRMLEVINERIEVLYDRDHTIGHSYLMKVQSLDDLNGVFEDSIIPLLQEYFMDDFEKIGQVLSKSGSGDADSMFVARKVYSTQFKNAPKHRYSLIPGPYPKEAYISIYSKQE